MGIIIPLLGGGGAADEPAAPEGSAAGILGEAASIGAALELPIPLEAEAGALSPLALGPLAAIVGAPTGGGLLGPGVTPVGVLTAAGNDADSESPAQPSRPTNANAITQDSNFRMVGSSSM